MSTPTTKNFPVPKSILRVEGDPTAWQLDELEIGMAQQLASPDPVALQVVKPLAGILMLAPRHAGSFVLSPLPPAGGWVPCVKLQAPHLYLPSTTGVAAQSRGYILTSPDTDLDALQQAIMRAMHDGSLLTVHVSISGTASVVVVNGAELPFAVLAEAEPQAG